jgi:spore coat protein JB
MPEMTNKPNLGAMPQMTNKPKTGAMPEMSNKPNTGTMPQMTNKPNMGAMPEMTNKPNTGMMPEMTNKPNMGMMPEMTNKPNAGAMPEMSNKPHVSMMPEKANQANMGMMPEMGGKNKMGVESACDYKSGELPPCAPLAVGFVPFQQKNPPKYSSTEALTKGTLFPGLDLPWNNVSNKTNPYEGTPLGDLMALGFTIKELNLYLDTHPRDKEALAMMQTLNRLKAEGTARFVQLYGPLTISDITAGDEYTWINNPWPWEYTEEGAKK